MPAAAAHHLALCIDVLLHFLCANQSNLMALGKEAGCQPTSKHLEAERQKKNVPVVKVDPPSQQCKKLYAEVHHPTKQQMAQVAKSAFGTASKVDDVERWFTHKRGLELLQSEARLKRRCGQVTPGVLADVER